MKLYKVIIHNNAPVSAVEISFSHLADRDDIALNKDGSLKWIPVLGFDAQDSIEQARAMMEKGFEDGEYTNRRFL